ncbi:hypothetical protein BOX15_Mlig027822g2 [Macrostomum lignano]|uniref:Uncharacterized protein n=2 Tax=Macrostomum lignano TaxID=282301 RepID=A0A267EQD7_9PLAT|nr:hypothetical protein BOX15_Mlig027822g1 [Macrostomum lignano]PAA92202.1 hypothetical protein BOX15_Mlig027822g2 [Macrostomum lignano]
MASSEPTKIEKVVKINLSRGINDEVTVDIERLEDLFVLDEEGNSIRFGDLYKDKKTVVVLLRHPQCFTAKEYAEDLAKIPDDYLEKGNVQLVTIGPHGPDLIPMFREETGFRHAMLCDPDAAIYKAIGCKCDELNGNNQDPTTSKHVKSGWLSGILSSTYRAMWYRDFKANLLLNGACLVLGPGKQVHSSHLDKGMFDQMPINAILEAVCGLTMSFPKDRRVLKV